MSEDELSKDGRTTPLNMYLLERLDEEIWRTSHQIFKADQDNKTLLWKNGYSYTHNLKKLEQAGYVTSFVVPKNKNTVTYYRRLDK